MCGRFTQKSERRLISEEFYIRIFSDDVIVNYNISPGQYAGIIVNENISPGQYAGIIVNDGTNRYVQYKWGLVPSWARDIQIGNKLINARAETLVKKPSFKNAFINRRCLVPTDGFYEWQKLEKYKVPFFIHLKSGKPFSFAGLWDLWGSKLYTFTIITTEANSLLKNIHDRMPVIIPEDKRELWLNPKIKTTEDLLPLLKPYGSDELDAYEVSRFVNSPANNSPECIEPV